MATQGKDRSADRYLPTLAYIMDRLDDCRAECEESAQNKPEFSVVATAAKAAWERCEKYFNDIDNTPTYYAAVILQPHQRLAWFQSEWQHSTDPIRQGWYEPSVEAVRQLWQSEYKGQFRATASTSMALPQKVKRTEEEDYLYAYYHPKISTDAVDAFEEYINAAPTALKHGESAITFAQSIEHSKPDLAAFIYDMAAIPAMSAECERVFSSAKLLLRDQRNRLLPIMIEAYECIRHWLLNAKDDILARQPLKHDKDMVRDERQMQAEEGDSDYAQQDNDDSDDGDDDFNGSYEVLDDQM